MRTEWNGTDNVPANVQPKPSSALTASEKLRLTYLTGQPNNAYAPRDDGLAWTGQVRRPKKKYSKVDPVVVVNDFPSFWDGF